MLLNLYAIRYLLIFWSNKEVVVKASEITQLCANWWSNSSQWKTETRNKRRVESGKKTNTGLTHKRKSKTFSCYLLIELVKKWSVRKLIKRSRKRDKRTEPNRKIPETFRALLRYCVENSFQTTPADRLGLFTTPVIALGVSGLKNCSMHTLLFGQLSHWENLNSFSNFSSGNYRM